MKRIMSVLLGLFVLTGLVVATTPALAAGTIVQNSLVNSPVAPVAGQPVTATLKVHSTSGCIKVQVISVGVRDSNGDNLDFGGATSNANICTGVYTHVTSPETFAAGTYSEFGYYEIGGVFHSFATQNLVVSVAAQNSPSQPTWAPTGSRTTTFVDEFNATGLQSPWESGFNCGIGNSCVSPPINPLETDCIASANVTQPGDGFLYMALTNVVSSCTGHSNEPYTASFVDSKLGFAQLGGSFEARVFVPSVNGQAAAWPAFWPTNSGNGDEVDVFEGLPEAGQAGATAAHTHYQGLSQGPCEPTAPDVGWHNFGVSVDTSANTATFYYDGTELCALPMINTAALHLTFENAIKADSVVPTTWPDTMLVDWVRVWSQP